MPRFDSAPSELVSIATLLDQVWQPFLESVGEQFPVPTLNIQRSLHFATHFVPLFDPTAANGPDGKNMCGLGRADGARSKGSSAPHGGITGRKSPNTPVGNPRPPPRWDRAPVRCGGACASGAGAERERSGKRSGSGAGAEQERSALARR